MTEETKVAEAVEPEVAVEQKPEVIKPAHQTISQAKADDLAQAQFTEAQSALMPTAKMLQVMTQFADQCVLTKQLPGTIDTREKCIMVFQAGRELGIPPMKALYSFYFVNNKLSMYGATVIERVRLWAKIEYGECNAETATITITRKDDGSSLSTTVTMADLKARGLAGKDTFTKHPKTMLLYKALGEIVRHIVPEALGSMAVEGDWGNDATEEKKEKTKVVDVVTVSDAEVEKALKMLADSPSKALAMRAYAALPTAVKLDDRVQNLITSDSFSDDE